MFLTFNVPDVVGRGRTTHPPSLQSPTPPIQARMNVGSARRETGFMASPGKYESTGQRITNRRACVERLTPREGCDGQERVSGTPEPRPPVLP